MRISICDSGEFSDDTGQRSSPRLEAIIRQAVLNERVRVSGISYIKSPPEDRLPGESEKLHEMRTSHRWEIERSRVCRTATTFQVKPTDDIERNLNDADTIVIVMRPSKGRSELIRRAIETGKLVIIYPPYFTSRDDLFGLRDLLSEAEAENIILWLPYRYSVAAKAIRERFQLSKIAALELTVSSAPYLHRLLIHEWSLPFLDVMRLIGGRFEKVEITRTSVDGLPVFHMKSIHRNASNYHYILGSSLITTAGGTLQNTEAALLKVFSTHMESIQSTGTFTGYIHRTNFLHEITEQSHDQQASSLTGYGTLLQCCLDNHWDDDAAVKPTLASFSQLQHVLDVFRSFQQDDTAFVDAPETKEITF